jgi:GT2 family glycosyltransferase
MAGMVQADLTHMKEGDPQRFEERVTIMDAEEVHVVVIILTLNQRDRTLQCLASLMAIESPPFHTVLWDNGSQDGTAGAVREAFPQVLVHYHPSNLGVASGRNAGAELAIQTFDPTHLLFLDNDMLVEAEFVSALLQPFSGNDQVGQSQAKLRFMHDKNLLNDGGGARINFLLWQITPVGYGEIDRGQHDTIRRCTACGGAMMVRSEIFQQLGGFDPKFDPFGPEDLDFSLRLQEAGYQALYVPQAVAYHVVSHTFGEGYGEDYVRHKARHWFTFMRRHASPFQQLGFLLLGAPYLAVRVMLREGRKGNLGALRGLVQGILDSSRASLRTGGQK